MAGKEVVSRSVNPRLGSGRLAHHFVFQLDARLADQRERSLAVDVPIPVSERLDALLDLIYREGLGRVSRKELVAALLHAAPADVADLSDALSRYRRATVRDTHLGEDRGGKVVRFPQRAPGPRARSS
jgi:hypothetical protein